MGSLALGEYNRKVDTLFPEKSTKQNTYNKVGHTFSMMFLLQLLTFGILSQFLWKIGDFVVQMKKPHMRVTWNCPFLTDTFFYYLKGAFYSVCFLHQSRMFM